MNRLAGFPTVGRPIGPTAQKILTLLIHRPYTLADLNHAIPEASKRQILRCIDRLIVDRGAVSVAGTERQANCKKPVRLYVATASGLQSIKSREDLH